MKLEAKFKVDYEIDDQKWSFYAFDQLENLVQKIMRYVILDSEPIKSFVEQVQLIYISIVFTNNTTIQKLNLKFRNKDKPTNVLSFPANDYYQMKFNALENYHFTPVQNLGDIVLAYETLKDEAFHQRKTFQDHFTHLIVHSILHLWGYDHIHDNDAIEMEKLEIKILKQFKIQDPYQDSNLKKLFRTINE